ncbi:hypothetical protein [Rhodococcus sp. MALMAid1271]|uniref:hypothetical protein n=1 Tax=Rhodococcus sp. MALMAid1271 TaxID=3411744 RepID=UPI003B9FE53F
MREQLEPAKGDGERTASVKAGSKLPISAAAVDSADETVALLCSWVSHAAEAMHNTGPDMSRTWQVLASRHTTDGERRVQGVRAEDLTVVDTCTRWLLDRIETIAGCDWVGDFMSELASQRSTALARWPYEERPRTVQGIRCDVCERCTLVVYAPAFEPKYVTQPLLVDGQTVPLVDHVNVYERTVDPEDGTIVTRTSQVIVEPRFYADGTPVVATIKVLQYAPPLLVQCQAQDCGYVVLPARWDVLSGRKLEEKAHL